MADTPNLTLPLIAADQAQKHVTHNEALGLIDAMTQIAVVSSAVTAPPGSPADGDRYIIPASATDAWSGRDDEVAARINGAWVYLTPRAGWLVFDVAAGNYVCYDGSAWVTAITLA